MIFFFSKIIKLLFLLFKQLWLFLGRCDQRYLLRLIKSRSFVRLWRERLGLIFVEFFQICVILCKYLLKKIWHLISSNRRLINSLITNFILNQLLFWNWDLRHIQAILWDNPLKIIDIVAHYLNIWLLISHFMSDLEISFIYSNPFILILLTPLTLWYNLVLFLINFVDFYLSFCNSIHFTLWQNFALFLLYLCHFILEYSTFNLLNRFGFCRISLLISMIQSSRFLLLLEHLSVSLNCDWVWNDIHPILSSLIKGGH